MAVESSTARCSWRLENAVPTDPRHSRHAQSPRTLPTSCPCNAHAALDASLARALELHPALEQVFEDGARGRATAVPGQRYLLRPGAYEARLTQAEAMLAGVLVEYLHALNGITLPWPQTCRRPSEAFWAGAPAVVELHRRLSSEQLGSLMPLFLGPR